MKPTQYKLTLRKRTQGHWIEDGCKGQLSHMAAYYSDRLEAQTEEDKRNEKLAQEMADGCGMELNEWCEKCFRDCDEYWHVIDV